MNNADFSSQKFRRRVPVIQKSLAILLSSFQGETISIELKNDSEITGILEETDHSMNLTLHQANQKSPIQEVAVQLDLVFINGSSIRYIHFPAEINLLNHMKKYMHRQEYLKSQNMRRPIKTRKKPGFDDDSANDDKSSTTEIFLDSAVIHEQGSSESDVENY